jgi:hypothetical protein
LTHITLVLSLLSSVCLIVMLFIIPLFWHLTGRFLATTCTNLPLSITYNPSDFFWNLTPSATNSPPSLPLELLPVRQHPLSPSKSLPTLTSLTTYPLPTHVPPEVNSMIRATMSKKILLININLNHQIRPEGGQPSGGR